MLLVKASATDTLLGVCRFRKSLSLRPATTETSSPWWPHLRALLLEGEKRTVKVVLRKKYFEPTPVVPVNVSTPAAGVAAGSHLVTVPAAQPMLDSSLLPDPAPMRPPFSVLFVGANMERGAQLKIREECRIIRTELQSTFGEHAWKHLVTFRADCFADPASFMRDVMQIAPGVLQFSCHGEKRGLWFSHGFTEASAIVDALGAHNREVKAKGGQRIQLVVVNACMSGPLAQALVECVDFVIGHGHSEVGDEEALTFSKTLYFSLGRGYSLDASFKAAKLASEPFQLHRSCNPEKFFLPVPDQRLVLEVQDQSDSNCNELVHFLKGEGLSAIAARGHPGSLGPVHELREIGVRHLEPGQVATRDAHMTRLRDWALLNDAHRIAVVGQGGSGKSTLAQWLLSEVGRGLRPSTRLVFFLQAGDLMRGYRELLAELQRLLGREEKQPDKDEDMRRQVHLLLRDGKVRGTWMGVLDDLPSPANLADKGMGWLLDARGFPWGSGKTVVTSRSAEWSDRML